jgi:hypothetical protein
LGEVVVVFVNGTPDDAAPSVFRTRAGFHFGTEFNILEYAVFADHDIDHFSTISIVSDGQRIFLKLRIGIR